MFNQGLNALVEVGKVSDQTFQQYILKALGELAVYVDGMHGLIQCNEIIRWLYQLTDSKVRGGGWGIERRGRIERGGRIERKGGSRGEGEERGERWRYRRARKREERAGRKRKRRRRREREGKRRGRREERRKQVHEEEGSKEREERDRELYGSWELIQDLQTVWEGKAKLKRIGYTRLFGLYGNNKSSNQSELWVCMLNI